MTKQNNIENEITIEEIIDGLSNCINAGEYRQFMIEIIQNKMLSGTASDFHNLAVELSRKNLYELACRVLEIGLSPYANDVDLLADFLVYGIKCGKETECEKYFNLLSQIPKRRWKWRAFDFSVDYLQQKAESILDDAELDNAITFMLEITKAYRYYFPNSEGSYVVESQIHRFVNKFDEEERVLKEAVKKVKHAPRSNLRLADNAFERGEYELSRSYIKAVKLTGIGKQSNVNLCYVYYLDTMCLIMILQSKQVTPSEINELYSLFAEAEMLMNSEDSLEFLKVIEQQIHLFEKRTGYRYDSTMYEGNKELINYTCD